jgi:uncharacterized protein (TIGR00106 family)
MSVVMSFAIFPIDKGDHVGEYVSKVVAYIRDSGIKYQFTPMATIMEADDVSELLEIVNQAHKILEPISDRTYCTITLDSSKTKDNRIESKKESIERRIGKI